MLPARNLCWSEPFDEDPMNTDKAFRTMHHRRSFPNETRVLNLDDSPGGRFDRNPRKVLGYRQMMALLQNGDIELAHHVMKDLLAG